MPKEKYIKSAGGIRSKKQWIHIGQTRRKFQYDNLRVTGTN